MILHQPNIDNMIGWMPSNEALSLAGWNTKKGASIRFGKLPVIIRFVTGRHKCVTNKSSETCYG